VNLLRNWTRNFPIAPQNAVIAAVESESLPSIRRALGLFVDLDGNLRGPNVEVELLSTFTLEPMLPALQLALNCLPSRARVRLAPLNDIAVYITRNERTDYTARLLFKINLVAV
jgi:hypothetical protein